MKATNQYKQRACVPPPLKQARGFKRFCGTLLATLLAAGIFSCTARATNDSITLSIDMTNYSGPNIPVDFSGLSYEKSVLTVTGTPYFAPSRNDIITSFKNLGLRTLRIGGGTAEGIDGAHPTTNQIAELFEFAQDAGVHVIYAVQLLWCNVNSNVMESDFILTNSFSPWLEYLAIGNEPEFYTNKSVWPDPDPRITGYPSYLSLWEQNANAIVASYPGATFAAPDSDWWGTNFVKDVTNPQEIKLKTGHCYSDFDNGNESANEAVSEMLSSTLWYGIYQNYYNLYDVPWVSRGYPYRLTEINDTPIVEGASDAFASALWALDVMHWFAANGCAGVNFHNNFGKLTDTIWNINPGNRINPKGYGIKAFDLGGHGYSVSTGSNPYNVACYATVGGQDVYVTIINKQYSGNGGSGGNTAAVTINLKDVNAGSVRAMYLTAPGGNVEATNGVTLGGGTLTNNAQFVGGWTDLNPVVNGSCTVDVAIAEAAVVDIHAASAYSNPIQVNNNGTLEMFAINAADGHVYHRWQNASTAISPSGSNPADWVTSYSDMGALATGVSAVDAPVVARNPDGTLEVLVPGSDGNIYDTYQLKPSGSWSEWQSIGGQGDGITNLQVNVNRDGSLNIFGVGSDGDIWNNTETAPHILGNTWTDFTDTSGVQGPIGVGQNLDGRLEVYGVNATGVLSHKWQAGVGSTGWNSWATIGSGVTLKPGVQVVRDVSGAINVFALDATSGNIDYIAQTVPGQGWGSWNPSSLGALPSGVTIQPGFVVAQNANGRFEIVALGSDGNVYHDWWNGSAWTGWSGHSLGGSGTDSHLVTSTTEDGRLQIFGVNGSTGDIWSIWQLTPAGNWNSWTDFAGNGMVFYPGQP